MENKFEQFECINCGIMVDRFEYNQFGVCAKCFDKDFEKAHAIPASGSVAAPKEEDEVSKLMAYKIQAYEQLAELTSIRQQLETLRGFVKEVDASLYHGSDLEDKEIMQHYIEVFKIIKEEAKKLLSEDNNKPSSREHVRL